MAICNALSTGLSKSCDLSSGGVNKIWVGDFTDLSYTLSSGKIDGITPPAPNQIVTTAATVNTTTVGPVRVLTTVTVPGNQTSIFTTGRWFYFTYNVMNIDGVTVTATSWSGLVLSSSYNAGPNTTTITPDFSGFTPLVGQSADPAPPNTNQTVSVYALYEIRTNKNVCNFQETVAIDMVAGTTFFNQVLTLVLSRRETTKRTFIDKLIDSQKQLILLILDSNNLYWMTGLSEGSYVTAIDGGTGTAKADANGYTITFTAMEPLQAFEVQSSALSAIVL